MESPAKPFVEFSWSSLYELFTSGSCEILEWLSGGYRLRGSFVKIGIVRDILYLGTWINVYTPPVRISWPDWVQYGTEYLRVIWLGKLQVWRKLADERPYFISKNKWKFTLSFLIFYFRPDSIKFGTVDNISWVIGSFAKIGAMKIMHNPRA